MNTRSRSRYMANMLADFYAAKQAWWEAAEYETMLYQVELAEYKVDHPMPRLQDFMRAARAERELAEAAAQWELAELAAAELEHDAAERDAEDYSAWLAEAEVAVAEVVTVTSWITYPLTSRCSRWLQSPSCGHRTQMALARNGNLTARTFDRKRALQCRYAQHPRRSPYRAHAHPADAVRWCRH